MLAGFVPEALLVTGGVGWLTSMRIPVPAQAEEPAVPIVATPTVPTPTRGEEVPHRPKADEATTDTGPKRDPGWDRVIEYLDPEEPGLAGLAHALADAGV